MIDKTIGRTSAGRPAQAGAAGELRLIPVAAIDLSPYQPRRNFDPGEMEGLTASVRSHGILQPILVRPVGDRYELVAGERRLRAALAAGLTGIPAVVRRLEGTGRAVLGLIENLQRSDLNCLEEAEGYARLIQDFGYTQEELARQVGKSQPAVANKLRLLRLGGCSRRALEEGVLSEAHGRSLLRLADDRRRDEVAERAVREGLSVRETDELIDALTRGGELTTPAAAGQARRRVVGVIRDVRILLNTFRQAVALLRKAGVPATLAETERDGYLEVAVRIPLSAARRIARGGAGTGRAAKGGAAPHKYL